MYPYWLIARETFIRAAPRDSFYIAYSWANIDSRTLMRTTRNFLITHDREKSDERRQVFNEAAYSNLQDRCENWKVL